jgi:hypothetical protein
MKCLTTEYLSRNVAEIDDIATLSKICGKMDYQENLSGVLKSLNNARENIRNSLSLKKCKCCEMQQTEIDFILRRV